MQRSILLVLSVCVLGAWGCAKVGPIITPQEYQAQCRQEASGADAGCVSRTCDVFQAVVTGYHENMDDCRAACRDRARTLAADASGPCRAKIEAAGDACLEFCNRKFYRCNCDK